MANENTLEPIDMADVLPGADSDWDHDDGGAVDRGDALVSNPPVDEPPAPVDEPPAPVDEPPAPVDEPPAPVDEPPAEDPEKAEREKDIFIPKARFDQRGRQLEAARRRIEELERQQGGAPAPAAAAPTPTEQQVALNNEMVVLQTEINELILDGKSQEAATKQLELNQKLIDFGTTMAEKRATETVTRQTSQQAYDAAVDNLEAKFEFLDGTSDNFDRDLTSKVLAFRDAYLNQGYSAADAVVQAAEDVVMLHKPELLRPNTPPPAAPRQTDVVKNVQAAAAQPPAMGGERTARAAAEATFDIMNATEAEFDNLTEAELRRLRGDAV